MPLRQLSISHVVRFAACTQGLLVETDGGVNGNYSAESPTRRKLQEARMLDDKFNGPEDDYDYDDSPLGQIMQNLNDASATTAGAQYTDADMSSGLGQALMMM